MNRTTKELEDDMSAPDMDLLMSLFDLLMEYDYNKLAHAVNRGFVGDKK